MPREPEELLRSALAVIDEAFAFEIEIYSGNSWYPKRYHADHMAALFSGGHVESGPLCSSCDLRAKAAGIEFKTCKKGGAA